MQTGVIQLQYLTKLFALTSTKSFLKPSTEKKKKILQEASMMYKHALKRLKAIVTGLLPEGPVAIYLIGITFPPVPPFWSYMLYLGLWSGRPFLGGL